MQSEVRYLVSPRISLSWGNSRLLNSPRPWVITVSMRSRLLAASSTVMISGIAASAAVTSGLRCISQSTSNRARQACLGSPMRCAVVQAAPDSRRRSHREANVVAWTPRTSAASDQLIRGEIWRALISRRSSSLSSISDPLLVDARFLLILACS
ncbi:hypothetical protein AHiyo8_41160 [Arthrobacter sp. Hiyo8]|nr:hypothetical protein AHiyo8_41160 [Arthrobacter sp. Hiyo8]